jgi:uncharacterized protein (DUF427 family)
MGLMTGTGPLSRKPVGRFNFEPPEPGRALYLEPTPKRVRVVLEGETVADSRRAMLLHESGHQPIYYFPPSDVATEFLQPSDRHTRCPKKGEASYHDIVVGDRVVGAGAWYYPELIESAPPELAGLIAFYWNRMDHWFEEGEEVFVHPRDPYHRVDILHSDRNVRVSLDGELLAQSTRALALFESNLPPRWYLPRDDVLADLVESETVTRCPYKGTAGYWSVRRPDETLEKDLVWYYARPIVDAARIAGLLCFFNERVDLELDGELIARPDSPWSRGVHGEQPASEPAPASGR